MENDNFINISVIWLLLVVLYVNTTDLPQDEIFVLYYLDQHVEFNFYCARWAVVVGIVW